MEKSNDKHCVSDDKFEASKPNSPLCVDELITKSAQSRLISGRSKTFSKRACAEKSLATEAAPLSLYEGTFSAIYGTVLMYNGSVTD